MAPAAKDQARSIIIDLVNSNQHNQKEQIVRIKSDDTEFGKKDYEVLEQCEPDAILIPKVNNPDDILKYIPYLQNKKTMIWAMMETPHAIINAYAIAACSKKLNCFVMGTNDLSKELNLNEEMRRTGLETSILTCLIAAKANGVSYFTNLSELNQKESPRLIWGSKILNMMGIKTDLTKDSIKIYGQPNLEIKKPITVKNYLKDHRVFMMSTIAALNFGGKWKIHDKDSINTSFPSFLKIIKDINHS